MDNSVQELQFLDLSGLSEGVQTTITEYLHGDPQLGKLSWVDQEYSAPVENDELEPTIEHYEERVNGDDEHSVPTESLATAIDIDAKPLPPQVQELPLNDAILIPAHEHPDPGVIPPVTVAAAVAPGVSHGAPHHPQDYHPAAIPAAQHPMYGVYGMPSVNMGGYGVSVPYGYQGQPPMQNTIRSRNRKSTGKPCPDQGLYNQDPHLMMMVDYQQNPTYYSPVQYFMPEQHQNSECYYNPYVMSYPVYPPAMSPYAEPVASKGPPDTKKAYSVGPAYYQPVVPKLGHPKNEEKLDHSKEFKPPGIENRNKSMDKPKPPQSALKVVRPDNYKKTVTGVKMEPADSGNVTAVPMDDKSNAQPSFRGPRPPARGAPPGRHSTSRQLSQEPPPASATSPPHPQKIYPMQPVVPAPVLPVPIPPVAVQPVVIPPGIPVLPVPPPPILHPTVPSESLPGAGVMVPPIAAAPPQPVTLPIQVPVVSPEFDVEVQCAPVAPAPFAQPQVTPTASPAKPPGGPPSPAVAAPVAPAPAAVSAPVKGATEAPKPPTPSAPTYASRLIGSPGQPQANKAPVTSGEKLTAQVKSFVNSEEPESKCQTALSPKPTLSQDKHPPQMSKPPAGAIKRRQDVPRKSVNAIVKPEPTEYAPAACASGAAPPQNTPSLGTSEATPNGTVHRAPPVSSTASVPQRGQTRFQSYDNVSQPQAQPAQLVSPSPTRGSAPLQQAPHGARSPSAATPAAATPACDGPVAQTPVATAKQSAAPPVEGQAAPPPLRSYAGAVSRNSSQFSPADTNSVDCRYKSTAQVGPFSNNYTSEGKTQYSNQESDSPSWEHKKTSAPVSKPIPAPPLPSLSKDPELIRLGESLSKYKLNHSSSSWQPRGLSNRSNWCYIHATLQALLACPPFYNLMKSLPQSSKDCNPSESCTPIIDSIVKFIHEFPKIKRPDRNRARDENASCTTPEVPVGAAFEPTYVYRMLSAIRSDTFKVEGRQEDAEEFLSCLLNGLHDEMLELIKMVAAKNSESGMANGEVETNGDVSQDEGDWNEMGPKKKKTVVRKPDFGHTPLSDIFRGRLRSCVYRDQNQGHTHNVQPFFTLQLDIEKAKSVNEALELYGTRDQLEGVTCAKTKKEVTAWQQVELEDLPPVLLLHLKCFDYKMDGCSKICRVVEYPVDLKVQTKVNCPMFKGSRSSGLKTYKLFAVVYHDGKEATKGHYIADTYHLGYNQWLRYDDSTVTPVRQEQVLHARQPRVPYLLYYRRLDTYSS